MISKELQEQKGREMRTDGYDVVSIATPANGLGLVQEMFATKAPSISVISTFIAFAFSY